MKTLLPTKIVKNAILVKETSSRLNFGRRFQQETRVGTTIADQGGIVRARYISNNSLYSLVELAVKCRHSYYRYSNTYNEEQHTSLRLSAQPGCKRLRAAKPTNISSRANKLPADSRRSPKFGQQTTNINSNKPTADASSADPSHHPASADC